MNTYTITEAEFNQLESVRGQLRLVGDLLSVPEGTRANFDAADLSDFLGAQETTVTSLMHAAESRFDQERDDALPAAFISTPEAGGLSPASLVELILAVSGDGIASERMLALSDQLLDLCAQDRAFAAVAQAFDSALERHGVTMAMSVQDGELTRTYVKAAAPAAAAPAAKRTRKRERLTVSVVS
ncbi:hypothetical protein GNX71_28670 [Variovorax sp. RKNM96]|uniref:hypothetical protein n=1 Tax=Variovorax sp. RKNM96 TaxID=2681552 RepID=UPI00197E768E|nr:hypothetical protein [Variovorax sp. RKNM96]QSI33324.1 hypothetical protein GNX71_28670 [Variovorax sp. RKNM96]